MMTSPGPGDRIGGRMGTPGIGCGELMADKTRRRWSADAVVQSAGRMWQVPSGGQQEDASQLRNEERARSPRTHD